MNAPFSKPIEEIIALRLKLRENGYHPVPVLGKVPAPMKGWQNICRNAAEYEIRRWSRDFPECAPVASLAFGGAAR
jgi:hypothetical protein